MKPSMKVVGQPNLKKKEKIGDHGVTPTKHFNALWVLIPVYFIFRNVKIHETVALYRKRQFATVTKCLIFKSKYIIEVRIFQVLHTAQLWLLQQ